MRDRRNTGKRVREGRSGLYSSSGNAFGPDKVANITKNGGEKGQVVPVVQEKANVLNAIKDTGLEPLVTKGGDAKIEMLKSGQKTRKINKERGRTTKIEKTVTNSEYSPSAAIKGAWETMV